MAKSMLEREIAAFEQMLPQLERDHYQKWAVFHAADFIGAYDSFDSAAKEAVKRFGRGPYLIRQVGAPPTAMPASLMHHRKHCG
jgi:hypothetical protein